MLSDISVECGTSCIKLAIQLCPVLYTGYNESLLILNRVFGTAACKGTLDQTVSPPVVRFTLPINMTNSCGSDFKVSAGCEEEFTVSKLFVCSMCLTLLSNLTIRLPVQPAPGSLQTSPTSRRLISAVWCAPMIPLGVSSPTTLSSIITTPVLIR